MRKGYTVYADAVSGSFEDRAKELAWLYVNCTCANKAKAYTLWKQKEDPEYEFSSKTPNCAYNAFRYKDVQKWVDIYYEENREEYRNQRDKNIMALNSIVEDDTVKTSDRINAVKELNCMFGYNLKTVNINGKVDSDITVEIV